MRKLIILLFNLFLIYTVSSCAMVKFQNIQYIDEAYEEGLISKDELEQIAYYYNNYDNVILDKNEISKHIQRKIKKDYNKEIMKEYANCSCSTSISIDNYYGTYDKCIAISLSSKYVTLDPYIVEVYVVDDVKFYNYSPVFLRIWVKK